VRFVREAGWGNAMRYMLTGEDWQEAHREPRHEDRRSSTSPR
jgi:hypothetical protein